jgi:hypothetical protein
MRLYDDGASPDAWMDVADPCGAKNPATRERGGQRMSKEALITVVQRSISDPAFRRQLATDATSALGSYALTADEFSALRSRDAGKLTALGVELRMSKVFTIDQGALGSASIASAGVQSPDAIERNLSFGDPASSRSAVQSPDAMDRNASLVTGGGSVEPRDVAPTWIGDGSETPAVHTFSGDDNPGPEIHVADADLQQ